MTIRIMLTDDHKMFRETLKIPLNAETDLQVIAEAGQGKELLALLEQHQPDVLVLDINLPDIHGIELAKYISRERPSIKILALSGYTEKIFIDEMLQAGAMGYVVKSAGSDELIAAIRTVARGERFLSPDMNYYVAAASAISHSSSDLDPPLALLGRRERQVLALLAQGLRSHEIAVQMGIAPSTVEVHRRNIRQKLGLSSIAELTRYALRKKIISG